MWYYSNEWWFVNGYVDQWQHYHCMTPLRLWSGGRFKNTYELFNRRILKSSPVIEMHIFRCMGKIFCVEHQRAPLRFHTKSLTHKLRYTIFTQCSNFKNFEDLKAHTRFGNAPRLVNLLCTHDDVIKWKHFPRYWPFARGIHRSPVNSPHKGQWRGALMFSLFCAWINGWVTTREAGDFRRSRAHYDVIVMSFGKYVVRLKKHAHGSYAVFCCG